MNKKSTSKKRPVVARKVEPVVGRCPKCNGTGYRHYDHNHMKVCEFCCKHDQGWWDLSPMHYGYIAGGENGCCKAGCGTLLRDINTPNPSLQGTGHLVDRTLQGVVGSLNQEG